MILVPLYERTVGNGQEIVDRENSAVIFHWNDLSVIADHSHQSNFSNLNKAIPLKTIGYIFSNNTTKLECDSKQTKPTKIVAHISLNRMTKLLCDDTQVGHILLSDSGNRLTDKNNHLVHTVFHDGYCIYTCIQRSAPNIIDVRLTHWRIIK